MKRVRTALIDRSRHDRDAALHVVATEDDLGPAAYFDALRRRGLLSRRVSVRVLSSETASAPEAVVDRLRRWLASLDDLRPFDRTWILLDVDHHFRGAHQRGTATALTQAQQLGADVLVSNPNFEVWLLFHVAPRPSSPLRDRVGVQAALRAAGVSKDGVGGLALDAAKVDRAVATARVVPMTGVVPDDPGSSVWRLVDEVRAR